MWTILEEKVSATRYATVGHLKTALNRAWNEITVEQCVTIAGNFRKRLHKYIAVQGNVPSKLRGCVAAH